ncbi:MAG: PHP domain-containing protein [Bacteroidales bacterium]|nr:PHP domain-containing protein [Bacteroidales bacterium]
MKDFRADLHIHTLLSTCGSLEMSPMQIIKEAKKKKINIIGITDHNSTQQCKEVYRIGKLNHINVFPGVEINTKEEVHCLAFFENFEKTAAFQSFLDENLPNIKNNPVKFGDQVWVDESEMIAGEETRLLISGLNKSIEEVEKKVHELNGIFIPAHIDRKTYSIISQLGFIPPQLCIDALELSDINIMQKFIQQFDINSNIAFITASDAHYPEQIGSKYVKLLMKKPTFDEFVMCLNNKNNRKIIIE